MGHGDAAHAMAPQIGQGASTALEDVGILAELLRAYPADPWKAFHLYEGLRVKRTSAFVHASRFLAYVNTLQNPLLCGLRDFGIATVVGGLLVDSLF